VDPEDKDPKLESFVCERRRWWKRLGKDVRSGKGDEAPSSAFR